MAKAYSYELRQKVLKAIELDGMKKSEASQIFNISRNTINLWFQRRAATGDVQVKPRQPVNPNQKITDLEKFRTFVNKYPDKTQAEMAELWEGELSTRTISRGLHKIGFTRKKSYGYPERDEEKRREFL